MLLEVKKHLREAAEREQQLKTISDDAQVGKDTLEIMRATNFWSPVPLVAATGNVSVCTMVVSKSVCLQLSERYLATLQERDALQQQVAQVAYQLYKWT